MTAPPAGEARARTAVVVLNWNNAPDTIRCLERLRASDQFELVVVDNGSRDNSLERIRAAHPEATYLPLPRNLGFARGVNAGLQHVLATPGDDVVVFLNNDAIVDAMDLEHAAALVRADHSIGMLTGKVIRHDGKLWYAGGSLHRWAGTVRIDGQGETDDGRFDRPRDVTFLSLAFAVARRDVIERVGLLAEEYFFGKEEWDYCLRVRQAGLRLRYEPSIRCVHGGDGSHANESPEFIYNGYRGKLIFQRAHLPPPVYWLWLAVFTTYAQTVMPRLVRRLQREPLRAELLRFCAKTAVRDHIRSRAPVEEADLLRVKAEIEHRYGPTAGNSRAQELAAGE